MNIMITKFGPHRLALTCDKKKAEQIVDDMIAQFEDTFTFMELCNSVRLKANEEGLLDKEPNTRYEGEIELSFNEIEKINLIVWKMIWERQLMILLYKNPYGPLNDGDFRFKKVDYH